MDEGNLTSLCRSCHSLVHRDELKYVEQFGGPPVKAEWRKRPRVAWNKLTISRLVRIRSLEYVGDKETYDIEVEGPFHNFVANGIITHNSVNEISARYSVLDREFYVPAEDVMGAQDTRNRQGRGGTLPAGRAREIMEILREDALRCYGHYEEFLAGSPANPAQPVPPDAGAPAPGEPGESKGWALARELARINLPVGIYTQWYWKTDLHNLLNFLRLRMDAHAQYEIRKYAEVIGNVVREWVPMTWEAFRDYRLEAVTLSRAEAAIVRAMLGRHRLPRAAAGSLSPRELRELKEKLGIDP